MNTLLFLLIGSISLCSCSSYQEISKPQTEFSDKDIDMMKVKDSFRTYSVVGIGAEIIKKENECIAMKQRNQLIENLESIPNVSIATNRDNNGNINIKIQNNILFKTGSSELNKSSMVLLDSLSSCINIIPCDVTIIGHTDNVGTEESNMTLSSNRASVISMVLKNYGIAESRMETKGVGENYPVSDNNTEQGREKNRRVEIVLIQK